MTLNAAINAALSGLRTSQAGIDLVSRNIANAGTPGYTRKTLPQENAISGGEGIGVRRLAAARQIDAFLQQQLRTERGITSSLDLRASFLGRIDQMFGRPEDESSIAGAISQLGKAFQALATDPESPAARQATLNDAERIADQLNAMTRQVQDMRLEAERNIAAAVDEANALLQTISDINTQISQRSGLLVTTADLADERDRAIDRLSELMEIRAVERDDGSVNLFTGGGNLLLGNTPVTLTFDERTGIDASSQYSTDPAQRTVGTISLVTGGTTVDLIAAGAFQSGTIGGYVELRDTILPETQRQLDELAAGLALALSEETVASTAVAGPPDGFEVDTTNLLAGNRINLNYTITPPGTPTSVTIIRVDDPSVLPLANTATADPNDTVIGINFNQPIANIVADLNAALPAEVVASNPAGNVLRFVDDGAGATSDINSLSATITATGLADSGTGLPLFVDGLAATPYSGSLDGQGQKLGFAGRIQVNPQVLADDTSLIVYQTTPATTPLGDPTRPLDLLARLTETSRDFHPSSGIGGTSSPFSGSIDAFARRVVSFQSSQAANTERDLEAQQIVNNTLQDRFDNETGVSIDDEMAQLLLLQNTYAANARVISTAQDLFNVLLSIGR